jgi:hypothetical protein
MRHSLMPVFLLVMPICAAQDTLPAPDPSTLTASAPVRTEFHVRYVSGADVYIDGGRSAGLVEGTELVLKQDSNKAATDKSNAAITPGVIAKLKVISVATTSAVCEVVSSARDIAADDVVWLPDDEVRKIVDKDTLGNTRQYPMVVSFSSGDPLDEEVRDKVPRPPLPEINQARGRIGFDISTIQQIGQASSMSSTYGMVLRADITRMFGTYWNLNGYWRGSLQNHSYASQSSLQDSLNRTYVMSLSYINPNSKWTAGVGRLYLPWASSLEVIDGGYVGRKLTPRTIMGAFAGSTPDPTAWNYNPKRKIGGGFFNLHGGNFEQFRYSSTTGMGVNTLDWKVDRPFLFTENDFSFKRLFSLYHSMQIDKPTANPSMPALNVGLGQSLLSLRMQVHPRITLDVTHTYFRDVPTYNPVLVGTGLLDKYLYQGINGGARIEFPRHLTGYFSLGQSSTSSDKKASLNELFGATMSHIWKTGLQADVRYSKFDSSFANGTYRSVTLTRDLGDRFRLNLQGGRYAYSSSLAKSDSSDFVNFMFDTNLGARLFIESAFTAQRGGNLNYNQTMTVIGYRFDNRASTKRGRNAKHP